MNLYIKRIRNSIKKWLSGKYSVKESFEQYVSLSFFLGFLFRDSMLWWVIQCFIHEFRCQINCTICDTYYLHSKYEHMREQLTFRVMIALPPLLPGFTIVPKLIFWLLVVTDRFFLLYDGSGRTTPDLSEEDEADTISISPRAVS